MKKKMTLEYWVEDDWFIGHLVECPEVISQGRTLEELEENILDAYQLVQSLPPVAQGSSPHRKTLLLPA